jgi:chemotaxis family two-component system sensor kinase Cph1
MGDEVTLIGNTPGHEQVETVRQWLDQNQHEYVFHTDKLSEHCPDAESFAVHATGLLSARIALGASDFILWFRPPAMKVVEWAGNPAKPAEETEAGKRISPRLSFERWKQTVGDRSEAWCDYEREFAVGVRHTVTESLLVEQNAHVTRLNLELERSNIELDAFAYAAGHDLQEPVRTLRAYSQLIARRAATRLTVEETGLLTMMESAASRMSNLISALLAFAQVGGNARHEPKPISMEEVLRASLMNLAESIRESGATVTNDPLPVVTADREHIARLMQNIIGNSIKYRRKEEPLLVHISAVREDAMWCFGVRDNGQGFDPQQSQFIFEAFRRLHGRDIPGTGVGLATCRRIVEQHGGRIWAESEGSGHGATFYFTLAAL